MAEIGRGRAVFVTQWFPPEPATQATRIALALQQGGFDTSVVTGVPNYPEGQIHPGYRATQRSSEMWNGFKVHRSPLYPSHDRSAVRRIANYASWAISATIFSTRHFRGARVSLVYSSPATAALPAMAARWLLRVPYVLLIQDLWPDSVLSSGFLPRRADALLRAVLDAYVALTYRWAAHVVIISPGMRAVLEERGVPSDKISLVYNAVTTTALTSGESGHSRESLGIPTNALLIMYGGNHGVAQDLSTVIRAIGEAREARPLHLMCVGSGVEKKSLQALAKKVAPESVTFLDAVPRDQIGSLMSLADVQLVSLAPDPLFDVTMPSKIQGILALGRPVWAIAAGDVADVVRVANAGFTSPPRDVRAATATIEHLARLSEEHLSGLGKSGREYYSQHMEASIVARLMVEVVERSAAD